MAKREEILGSYSQAAQQSIARDKKLYPAEYMLASNPGPNLVVYRGHPYWSKYSSADSAGRAFRKLRSGETSGERMYEYGKLFPKQLPEDRGYEMRRGKGGRQEGLWKITVYMAWDDQDGNQHGRYTDDEGEDQIDYGSLEQRSFIVETMNYTSYYDAKALEYAAADAIEEHVAAWEQDYNVGNIEVVYVEMVKIQGYNVPGDRVVDL